MQPFDPFDGALLIDKPAGPTSHDIVDLVRRHYGIRKAGHCGTLDPNATGLLILVLGRATKLSEKLMAADKIYQGDLKLGESTTTYDAAGEVTQSAPPPPELNLDSLNTIAETFVGDQMQLPPMVSAVKQDGVPLYKLARKGIEVERKPRFVHIYRFRFLAYDAPLAHFRIACTKGTYVRTLAHDFGQKLGCGAHLSTLRRIASGKFNVADAIPMEALSTTSTAALQKRVIPILQLGD